MPLSQLLNWRLHLLVVVLSLLSEWVGILKIPLGPGTLLLVHREHRWLPWCRVHLLRRPTHLRHALRDEVA